MAAESAANFSKEIPTLLRVLSGENVGLSDERPWQPFAKACDEHQVAPFVYCRLKDRSDIPAGLLAYLRQRFHESSADNYRLAGNLIDLTSMLHNEGVPTLAFKGPALAMAIYGDLALRHFQDLDLLIRRDHLRKAVDTMSGHGFQITPQFSRPQMTPYWFRPENPRHVAVSEEIAFRAPDRSYFVDLHWQLGHDFWRPFSPDTEKMWERTEIHSLSHGKVTAPCREDLFLALCYHGTKHRWLSLKWLVDIAELLRTAETLDWSRVEEMAGIRPEISAPASVAVLLAHELLDAPIPAEAARILTANNRARAVATAIRQEILTRGRSTGDNSATFLGLEKRRLVRMKYRATRIASYPGGLLREVFVLVSPKDRAVVSIPERIGFLYHIVRPIRLLVKHTIRAGRAFWTRAAQ